MEIIHSRLYRLDNQWYADEVPISPEEGEFLRDHYFDVVDRLAAPWRDRNEDYDSLGRFNTGGMSEYDERF